MSGGLTKYEKLYRAGRHALGEPTPALVRLLERYDGRKLSVLDVGCGQGRDALWLGRRGHSVTGVDNASTGIAQMLDDARQEALRVDGIVSDVQTFKTDKRFDLIVCDRTLHMLDAEIRGPVLARLLAMANSRAAVLVEDERSNMPALRTVVQKAGFNAVVDRPATLLAERP